MRIKHILLVISFSLSLSLFAQHNEEVTIEGTYRPKVNKVDKILMQPEAPKQSFEMPDTEVSVLDIEHRFPLELNKLSAMAYNGKNAQKPEPAKNFLMAGFGSRISPVFLYKHNSNLTKNLGLGVGIKHYSSWLDIKDLGPSAFMNNAFDIGLTSTGSSNLQIGGNVYYLNDMVHYYGIPTSNIPAGFTLEQVRSQQVYNTIGTHFGLTSTSTRNGEFVHDLGMDYHYLFGKIGGGKEHFARLDYDFGYVDSWWGKKNYPQKIGMTLGVQFDRLAFLNQNGCNNLILNVNPYFEMKDDFYRLHLGMRIDGASTSTATNNRFLRVYPDLKGSLFVMNNTLEFYAGLNGGRKLFTYSDIVKENPFVGPKLDMEVTTVKFGFDGGVRTNIMNTLDIHVGVRYRHTDKDPFYVIGCQPIQGFVGNNSYDVFYDETHAVSVMADVRWLALDKVTVDAGVGYNKYKTAVLAQALYRPAFEGRLKVNYNPTENLLLYSSFLFQHGRFAKVQRPDLTGDESFFLLKPVMDLGIGADYRVKDGFTVFAKANNLLHQKYQLYYNYPVAGIELFAGVKLTF